MIRPAIICATARRRTRRGSNQRNLCMNMNTPRTNTPRNTTLRNNATTPNTPTPTQHPYGLCGAMSDKIRFLHSVIALTGPYKYDRYKFAKQHADKLDEATSAVNATDVPPHPCPETRRKCNTDARSSGAPFKPVQQANTNCTRSKYATHQNGG